MLKYWLSVPLIGITLILVACSESPTSSGGVVMSKGEGGGQITINVEQTGGHGAIELYLADDLSNRIAVAEGQCTGDDSCNASITVAANKAAEGIKVVWSAKHLGQKDYYLASAYTCSPGSTGCTSNRIDYRYTTNKESTQASATFKVEPTAGSITIGGSFSENKPAGAGTGGVNYCMQPDGVYTLKEGEVLGNAACQAVVNRWAALCGLRVRLGGEGWASGGPIWCDNFYGDGLARDYLGAVRTVGCRASTGFGGWRWDYCPGDGEL
jgi:hypothetical protein